MNQCLSRFAGTYLTVALLALCGCGKHAAMPNVATDTKAFDSAGAELKADWNKVVAAVAAKDYATVILTCRDMYADPDLTPEQRTAVLNTGNALQIEMFKNAEKGDVKAKEAIAEVRKAGRNRSAH